MQSGLRLPGRQTDRSRADPKRRPAPSGPPLHDPDAERGSALAGPQCRLSEEVLGDDLVPDRVHADPAVPGQPGLVLADASAGDLLVDRDDLLRPAVVALVAGRRRGKRAVVGRAVAVEGAGR